MKRNIKIKNLSFNDSACTTINVGKLTIIVGQNHSGKSTLLREIKALSTGKECENKIIKTLKLDGLPNTKEEFIEQINPFAHYQEDGFLTFKENYTESTKIGRIEVSDINRLLNNPLEIKKKLVSLYTIHSDAKTRFNLVEPNITSSGGTHLRYLSTGTVLESINKILSKTFKMHLIPCSYHKSQKQDVYLFLSLQPPSSRVIDLLNSNPKQLTYWDEIKNELGKNMIAITEAGDGVQTFIGIITAILARPQTIILIDEPEAFLSPPIARKLGAALAQITKNRDATLIISTHSAEFLMGCLEECHDDMSIVRLKYENKSFSHNHVAGKFIQEFYKNPCLRNAAAIRGLFYKAVIITEGHRDRVFYDEINRLLTVNGNGMEDVLFLDSGGGKNGVYKFIEPLRKLGVQVATILDIDFIMDDGDSWNNLINATIPKHKQQEIVSLKDKVLKQFKAIIGSRKNIMTNQNLVEET